MSLVTKPSFHSALVGLVFTTVLSSAHAQSDPAAARVLFDEGRKLLAEQKYAEACPKFEESQKLDPGTGTLFNLADCWEHIGRTASAWAHFREVADAAGRAGQQDRERIARARIAAIEPKLSRLVVEVKAAPGTELTKDGVSFNAALWGSALPIDPGTHTIEANAPSKQTWTKTVEVPANGATVSLVVPPLEDKTTPSEVPPPIADLPDRAQGANASGGSSRTKLAGWVLEGLGVVGLAVGTGFALRVAQKNTDADAICPESKGCTPVDKGRFNETIGEAYTAKTFSIIGFASGGAALAGGTILLLTAPTTRTAGFRVAPSAGAGAVGAVFAGTW